MRHARPLAALVSLVLVALAVLRFGGGAPLHVDESGVAAGPHPSVLVSEPLAMVALEARGFALGDIVAARGNTNDLLAESPVYASLVRVLRADLAELAQRPGVREPHAPNHPFEPAWLTDRDARFELVGFVPRLDRAFVEPGTCGELRLVYRLALTRAGRPTTRLPMTLSVLTIPHGDDRACGQLARALVSLPAQGSPRITAIAALLDMCATYTRRIEVNLQNLHGPATPRDAEDHAEYLLRSFDVAPGGVTERPLFDTPREDPSPELREELGAFIREHFAEIDRGTHALPAKFLATRAVSVSPRGLARARNRPFLALFGDDVASRFADMPYATALVARSPRALLRRLDESTCQGCHQSRAVAGFHLLGEERTASTFNALAVGESSHLLGELPWREAFMASLARGESYPRPRPLAERATEGPGLHGERCGLGDPGFSHYGCAPGLACADDRSDELGACAPTDGNHEGDACEGARVESRPHAAEGDHLAPLPRRSCLVSGVEVLRDACIPNETGFPGGMCTGRCDVAGGSGGAGLVCMEIPRAGYEEVCFKQAAPVEPCIAARADRLRMRACDAATPCRDDYACARAPGLTPGRGACVPPYFVFQARVDGPRLDR